MNDVFANRAEAGRLLARELLQHAWKRPVVLALPRGGVPVAVEVALALRAPLDLVLVRKIGARGNPELAVGAVAEGSAEPVLDLDAMEMTGTYRAYVEARARAELDEIMRRRAVYLGGRAPLPLAGSTAIVVDDGLATGTTARAALRAVRARRPAQLVLAVPVGSRQGLADVAPEVDVLVCLSRPAVFSAVGLHYADFHQLTDDEVLAALARVRSGR
ncbi:phosphoribosyltransferase [Ramlibacter sp. AN1133]|uniref:phosphoribosyltransferase n=1 Tax=Ramlibacter sp. AN1133 TaxID=3133429 RepID=UPI0030BEAAC7